MYRADHRADFDIAGGPSPYTSDCEIKESAFPLFLFYFGDGGTDKYSIQIKLSVVPTRLF